MIHSTLLNPCQQLCFNFYCFFTLIVDIFDTIFPTIVSQLTVEPKASPLNEFMYNTPRSTMQGFKDATNDSLFVVLGTIKKILNPDSFYYTICHCLKAVIPDSSMWFCEKCDKHVMKVYNRDSCIQFNRNCTYMLDGVPRGFLPKELEGLVDQTLLFKVETKVVFNTKFEQSFRVRKIGYDAYVIAEFKKKWETGDAIISRKTNVDASLSTLIGKGKSFLEYSGGQGEIGQSSSSQDLMPKFVYVVKDSDVKDCEKSTMVSDGKRVSPSNQDVVPMKLLKRSIKLERFRNLWLFNLC